MLYRKADLEEDFDDHAPNFGIDSKEEYIREARHVVRDSNRILAKNYAGMCSTSSSDGAGSSLSTGRRTSAATTST